MINPSIIDAIVNTKELATLPAVATHVLRMLEVKDVDIREVVKILQNDPALSLKILKIANSPIYATRREISSVQQAVMLIGLNRLVNIVLGVSIFSKFWLSTQKGAEDLMNKFWWHSAITGSVAKSIANKIHRSYNENEFIGGLLHKIGKLAMVQFNISKYMEVVNLVETEKITDFEAEENIFNVNHIAVGERIANLWKLPEEISLVISNYADPAHAVSNQDLVATVNFAGLVSIQNGADFYSGINGRPLTDYESWNILCNYSEDLKQKGVQLILDDLDQEIEKSSNFLGALKQ